MSDQVPGDPNTYPPGHPLRKLATQMGVPTQVGAGAPPGAQAGFQQSGAAPQPQAPHMGPQLISKDPQANRSADPLSRPYMLPSGGMLYGDHDGRVLVSPMRGEQEELIAGSGTGLSATPALRHVVKQCVDTQGIPYEKLELADWSALLLHVMAMSMGTDMLPLYPACPHCGVQFDGSRSLAEVPCRVLRRVTSAEQASWPPESSLDADEDLRILREMGLDTESEEKQSAQQVYTAHGMEEPIEVEISNGQRIGWRYLRLGDLIQAEEFAERSHNTEATRPGAKLNSFINARFIATIDGRRVGVLEAMKWTKQAPMPLLVEFRQQVERRSFGYELSPSFRCPSGHSFRQRLPLNGAMFRGSGGATVR